MCSWVELDTQKAAGSLRGKWDASAAAAGSETVLDCLRALTADGSRSSELRTAAREVADQLVEEETLDAAC